MGCGSSFNQVHDNHAVKQNKPTHHDISLKYIPDKDSHSFCQGKCYLFGQTAIQKKVICYDSQQHNFDILSSRVRIPTPKVYKQPIQILYQQSQDIIHQNLFKQIPKPPFNRMFGTFFKADTIFLCGGITYEGEDVSSQAFFYRLNLQKDNKSMNKYKKFQNTSPMITPRYNHFGIFKVTQNDGIIYIFGGSNQKGETLATCQKFSITEKKWTQLPSMTMQRSEGFAFLFMEKIYVLGGMSCQALLPKIIEVFDTETNQWKNLQIKLHRGIRSGLLISPNPNQILLLGGCSNYGQQLSSVIRFNLVSETYQWQSDIPQKMSSCKATVNKSSVMVFGSGKKSLIRQYNYKKKQWKQLGYGFTNYIPSNDLKNFTLVTQPLVVDFSKQKIIDQKCELKQNQTYLFGNQDYPFICKIETNFKNNKIFYQLLPVPMTVRLSSHIKFIQTQKGILGIGGTDTNQKKGTDTCFMFNQGYQQSYQTASCMYGRFQFACQRIQNKVYIIGGITNRSNPLIQNSGSNHILTIQIYDIQSNNWSKGPNLNVGRSRPNTVVFGKTKILIFGGKQHNKQYSSSIQIYDAELNRIVMSMQFMQFLNSQSQQFFQHQIPYNLKNYVEIIPLNTEVIQITNKQNKFDKKQAETEQKIVQQQPDQQNQWKQRTQIYVEYSGQQKQKKKQQEDNQFQYVMDQAPVKQKEQQQQQGSDKFYVVEIIVYCSSQKYRKSILGARILHILIQKQTNQLTFKYPLKTPMLPLSKPIQTYDYYFRINKNSYFIDFFNQRGAIIQYSANEKLGLQNQIKMEEFRLENISLKNGMSFNKMRNSGLFSVLHRN